MNNSKEIRKTEGSGPSITCRVNAMRIVIKSGIGRMDEEGVTMHKEWRKSLTGQ